MTRDEEGSVLVLGIGLTVVVAAMLTVAVNIAVLWEQRTSLNSLADGAALAGAQAVDRSAVFTQGLEAALVLDPPEARRRVREYINRAARSSGLAGVTVERITVERTAVTVTLTAPPRAPFGYFMPSQPRQLRATARGINRLR